MTNTNKGDPFAFRVIQQQEIEQAIAMEQICFPPNEACSAKAMTERIQQASELFLVAIDTRTCHMAGLLNGLATNESTFRDAFFTDVALHDPHGQNIMLLGLEVLPRYQGQGLATKLMAHYLAKESKRRHGTVFLTCHQAKVKMYRNMGFIDQGISASTWGGEVWHDMSISLDRKEKKRRKQ